MTQLAILLLTIIGNAFAGNSINSCIFRASSVTSDAHMRVVSYYDIDSTVVLAFQKKDSDEWKISKTQLKANIADAHNVISIALDGKGYIHLCWGMHSSPLKYCRSLEPYGAAMGPVENMVGRDESNVTYPSFFRTRDGGLLFFYRAGGSGNGNLVLNRYDQESGKWSRVQNNLIDGEGKRNAYPQYFVDSNDNIHISWVWRESPDVATNHDMCYAFSSDYGKTWHHTDGSICHTPITLASAEYACRIPQNSDLMNQTTMTSDRDGHPYIVTYWRSKGEKVPQYRLIWHDGRKWKTRQIGRLSDKFHLGGEGTVRVPISRPAIAVAADGSAYCLFRAEEFGSKVNAWRIPNLKRNACERLELSDFSVGAWEPTLDTESLRRDCKITVFIQKCEQSGGDNSKQMCQEPIYLIDL